MKSKKKSAFLTYMLGEGIPVSWQYPQTPSDINPYIITLKKAHSDKDRAEIKGRPILKMIPTKSNNSVYNTYPKEDNYTAALRRRHMLDTPCNSALEFRRPLPPKRGAVLQQESSIVCGLESCDNLQKAYPDREKKRHINWKKFKAEFHNLKSEIQDLKRTVLSIKSECSHCNHRRIEHCSNKHMRHK